MDEMNLRDILIAKLALEEALGSQINELITDFQDKYNCRVRYFDIKMLMLQQMNGERTMVERVEVTLEGQGPVRWKLT